MENVFWRNKYQQVLNKIKKSLSDIRLGMGNQTNYIYEILGDNNLKNDDMEIVNSIIFEIQEINEQMKNISWLNTHYKIIHDFAQTCSKTLNEEILLKKAYELVSQVMPTDSFFIASYNEGDSYINFLLMVENEEYYPEKTIELGDNYTSKAIKTREIIHQKDSSHRQENEVIIAGMEPTSSLLFVPVIIDDHVRGVISAQSFKDFAFRKEHEELLQLIGTQVINSIETARLYEKIYIMSQTDELTGLKNHRAFHEELSEFINKSVHPLALIMIDSDDLKRVNDNYGHDVGDLYLQTLANGIKSICNEDIVGYRYAGDEFMIIIKGQMSYDYHQLYHRLRNYYKSHMIKLSNIQINISFSSGLAIHPIHGSTVDTLKKSADRALYVAKQNGKSQLVIAGNKA